MTNRIVQSHRVGGCLEWGGCELKGRGRRARGLVVVVFLDNKVLQLLELEVGNFRFLVVLRTVRAAFVGVLHRFIDPR